MTIGLALGCGASGQAQAPSARVLGQIDRGQWQIRQRFSQQPAIALCVHDGVELIQLRHPGLICEQYIVDDGAQDLTIQYTCRGRGYGRTHLHRENARLVQVETQGIAGGFPFDFVAEARRTGECHE